MSLLPELPPIDLTDVLAGAALLTRVDRKYLLTRAEAATVLDAMARPGGARVLEIGGRREFDYASVYFDTADLDSFRGTATGRRRRWKVRTRSYLDTGDCWLEVKTRGSRGRTVKERIPHPAGWPRRLDRTARAFVAERLRSAQVNAPARGDLRPVLSTAYRRSTLVLADGVTRATVDTGLRWLGTDGTELDRQGVVVVETKTGSSPSPLDRTLWAAGHRPTRISKFGTGMVLLDPDLSHHRWNRLVSPSGALAG